jgi:hypothetical protein
MSVAASNRSSIARVRSYARPLLWLFIFSSSAANAQRLTPSGVRLQDDVAVMERDVLQDPRVGHEHAYEIDVPVRMVLGTGGAIVGFFAGAAIEVATSSHTCHDGPCFDGLGGGMLGSIVGATLMAAGPKLASSCGMVKRLAIGLAGGTVGGLAGGYAGAATTNLGGLLVGVLAGAGVGSAAGALLCDI